MFNYNKTIARHLEILEKYEEPHILEEHMKGLYKTYTILIFSMLLSTIIAAVRSGDSYAFVFILSSAMSFILAVKAWIDLQNLVMYRFLRERCVPIQNTEHSIDE